MRDVALNGNRCSSINYTPSEPAASAWISDASGLSENGSAGLAQQHWFPPSQGYSPARTRRRGTLGESFSAPTIMGWPAGDMLHAGAERSHRSTARTPSQAGSAPSMLSRSIEQHWRECANVAGSKHASVTPGVDDKGIAGMFEDAMQTLARSQQQCASLQQRFNRFVVDARLLMTPMQPDEASACDRQAAFDQIVAHAAPHLDFASASERRQWESRTLASPQSFLLRAYEGMKRELSRVATTLPPAHDALFDVAVARNQSQYIDGLREMQRAATAIATTRQHLENAGFPLNPRIPTASIQHCTAELGDLSGERFNLSQHASHGNDLL